MKRNKAGGYNVTTITDPDLQLRGDLQWLFDYFEKVDKPTCPSNKSTLCLAGIRCLRKHVERTQPKKYDPHNLF